MHQAPVLTLISTFEPFLILPPTLPWFFNKDILKRGRGGFFGEADMIFPPKRDKLEKQDIKGTFIFNKDSRSPFWDILDFHILD